jgi:putative ABC transport system permease protein
VPASTAPEPAVTRAIASAQAGPAENIAGRSPYTPGELALLALVGLAIALAGALGPAIWAAASRTTTALRAE